MSYPVQLSARLQRVWDRVVVLCEGGRTVFVGVIEVDGIPQGKMTGALLALAGRGLLGFERAPLARGRGGRRIWILRPLKPEERADVAVADIDGIEDLEVDEPEIAAASDASRHRASLTAQMAAFDRHWRRAVPAGVDYRNGSLPRPEAGAAAPDRGPSAPSPQP